MVAYRRSSILTHYYARIHYENIIYYSKALRGDCSVKLTVD
jgi:hypothetical protein